MKLFTKPYKRSQHWGFIYCTKVVPQHYLTKDHSVCELFKVNTSIIKNIMLSIGY